MCFFNVYRVCANPYNKKKKCIQAGRRHLSSEETFFKITYRTLVQKNSFRENMMMVKYSYSLPVCANTFHFLAIQ